ncbi:hypothetical protein Tco_0706101 [Tanacetum coccineum]|uniref:Uncharacterized protein n=1 Tax=Tanacetum coccineum TaxID=301880 RepID=A0ABQ4Y6K6_9ASTR
MLHESDFDAFDGETVDSATTGVSTASAPVTTAGVAISTAEPRTPPITTTVFDDKDVKAKEKGVAFKDVEDSSRHEPKKVKSRDQGLAQIESDAELAQRLHEEELADRKQNDSSSKPAGGSRKKTLSRKRAGEKKSEESAKKQKLKDVAEEQESSKSDEEAAADYAHEKEELRMWLTIVSDEEETMDPKILKFDRQELVDLHRLVMKRFEDTTPEGYNLLLWGDLKSCGVHTLLMDGTLTCFNMLVEKMYPLIKEMLQRMLNWKLEAEAENTMTFELLKFIKSQLEE